MLSLSLLLYTAAAAPVVDGEKFIAGCYIVNLRAPSVPFLEERPQLSEFLRFRWGEGFSVERVSDEKWFFELVRNATETISIERCGPIRPHGVLNVAAAGPNKRAIDRVDQRAQVPDGLLRRTASGSLQRIYLVDSGLRFAQQTGNVFNTYSLNGSYDDDGNGHGSAMLEMINANDVGLAEQVLVFNLKGYSNNLGGARIDSVISALRFLYDGSVFRGGQLVPGIVNLSLGQRVLPASTSLSSMELVVNDLRTAGFVIVASAGNEDQSIVNQAAGSKVVPAAVPGVITVAGVSLATLGVDTRWANDTCPTGVCGSNYGPEVSLFAPATNQPTRDLAGNLVVAKGTSGAAAYVSAVLASVGNFRPALALNQRFAFIQSLLNTSGVANAQSANTGMLMSDLGYVRAASPATLSFAQQTRVCPGQTATSSAPKTVTASARAARTNTGLGPALVVASTSVRNANCPGTPLNGGPVDLIVEAFNPETGALLWQQQLLDPNATNVSFSDNIAAVFEWETYTPVTSSTLAVLVSSNEPGRFSTINTTVQAGAGLDTYIVLLSVGNGSIVRVIRNGGPGEDVGNALATVASGSDLLVAGTSNLRFNGGSVNGLNDVFGYAIGSDYALTSNAKFVGLAGSQSIQAATAIPGGTFRSVLLVGGTDVGQSAACSGTSVDTLLIRLGVTPRTSGPGTGGVSIISSQSFESPTSVSPAIQLDDRADSIAEVSSSTAVLGIQTRQFDCFGGGPGYFGPGSAQLVQYNFATNQVGWFQSRGVYNLSGRVTAVAVGTAPVTENYHLVATSTAWKFDLSGTQIFSETVPSGPLVAFAHEFNAWFGDANSTEARLIR